MNRLNEPLPSRSLMLLMAMLIMGSLVFGRYFFRGPVFSDPYASLIVSQSIIENGTIRLDEYAERLDLRHHAIKKIDGHLYDHYPLGSSILSLPLVYLGGLFGLDMLEPADLGLMHSICATLVLGLALYITCLIGMQYVSSGASIAIALSFFLGTPISSALATQLWSHSFPLMLNLLAIYLLVREDATGSRWRPYILGAMLFISYLCRPTSSLFILAVLAYLLAQRRWAYLLKASCVMAGLLACLACFSYWVFGQPLPPYYMMSRWETDFLMALYGILLSPSRGLLVFCPFLILVLAGIALSFKRIKSDWLFWMALAWFLAHVVMIANFSSWPGGHSFGPRLMVDSMPALMLITFIVWRGAGEALGTLKRPAIVLFTLTAILAVWIHSYQGLFNLWSEAWLFSPQVSPRYGMKVDKSIFFDWRFPQFLADRDMYLKMIRSYYDPVLGKGNYEISISGYDVTVTAPGFMEKW